MTVVAEASLTGEEREVEDWRYRMFRELGLRPDDAAQLAHSHVDWHEVKRLLENGCSPELVLRIAG